MGNKGETTKRSILEHALGLATSTGLEGLSIGRLAGELHLSKSGLFAHFQSKEALQIQVLQTAAAKFQAEVVRPAVSQPRGAPRLAALFERWLDWGRGHYAKGRGCVFLAAAVEFDDQPGPVRDQLVETQRSFIGVMTYMARQAMTDGLFRAGVREPERVAQDVYGIMMSFHLYDRLLRDPEAERRARASFADLLAGLSTSGPADHDAAGQSTAGDRQEKKT